MPRISRAAVPALCLLLLFIIAAADTPHHPRPGHAIASASSNLESSGGQIRQFAFDGSPETYFASATSPGPSDHFTIEYDPPLEIQTLEVLTGRPDGSDKLADAVLELSKIGKTFEVAARFHNGVAKIHHNAGRIRAIRIRLSEKLAHPLVIREIAIKSNEPVPTFAYPVEFTVNAADAPEMSGWVHDVARLCERWYPRINQELKSPGFHPPTQISITLKQSYNGVAEEGGDHITASVAYFKQHPSDAGAFIHETCHAVQHYKSHHNPGWLVEGVADYVRYFVYEPGTAGHIDPATAHYNHSYRTTATFLAFVAARYHKHLVHDLNRLMREGKYQEDTFQKLTGRTLEQLDSEWLESLRDKK